jgi:excinuclease UvrABC helicase subunit UvrB
MSGIEVAGLVLGSIPLIISALESYNEGLDPVKSFIRWERELPQFIRKLRNQHVHFAQTTRLLLEPITTEFELAEMLSEPSGKLWKDDDMTGKLKDKLQESYHAYQSTITDIERIMKKIASKLDLERATEVRTFLCDRNARC